MAVLPAPPFPSLGPAGQPRADTISNIIGARHPPPHRRGTGGQHCLWRRQSGGGDGRDGGGRGGRDRGVKCSEPGGRPARAAGGGGEVVGVVAPTAVSLPLSAPLGLHPTTTAPTAARRLPRGRRRRPPDSTGIRVGGAHGAVLATRLGADPYVRYHAVYVAAGRRLGDGRGDTDMDYGGGDVWEGGCGCGYGGRSASVRRVSPLAMAWASAGRPVARASRASMACRIQPRL